jgi:hypothetical protein
MSRTEEDIQSRVDITIMRHPTLRAYPASYSEVCDTFRPRLARARRTDSGRERFIDFLVPGPARSRLVAEHASEGRPARIENRLRHAGLDESRGTHIADRNIVELSNDAGREFMVKVTAGIGDPRVKVGRLTPFAGALRGREFISQFAEMPRVLDLLPGGQGREVFESQVNPNTAAHRPKLGLGDFHDDVQEPMTASIAGKVRSIPDLSLGQRPRVEHPEGVSGEAKGFPLALKIPAFQGHPAQGAPAAPAQERPVLLTTGLGVLFAHRVDGARVEAEFLAATRGQPIEIKAARPGLVPFEGLQLGFVAEIPDEVAGAGLPAEQTGQRLDAVSIDQQHTPKLVRIRDADKTSKLTKTPIFRRSKSQPQERHFLPGSSAGDFVPENR